MNRARLILLSAVVVGAMLLAAILTLAFGPHHEVLPVHWNVAGVADGFAPPWLALLTMPLATTVVAGVMMAVQRMEPRQEALAKSAGLLATVWFGVLLVLSVADLMIVAAAWNWPIAGTRLIVAAIGVLFALLGNQLGKSRPMYMVGIRTPWTLANEDVWIATHRLGGKLMVAAGLLCLVLAAIGPAPERIFPVMIAALALSALIPVIYSYVLWRRL